MPPEKPRFRRDLEARPVVTDGQSYVEIRDTTAGTSFLLYDFEYQVALAFDGLPLDKVIPWIKLATGLALQVEQLREFAARLEELGFLEHEPSPESPPALQEAPAETSARVQLTEAPHAAPSPEPSKDTAEQAGTQALSGGPASESASTESVERPAHENPPERPLTPEPRPAIDEVPEREATPGPPDPDAVVMHPSEVVGETPLPIPSPGRQDAKQGANGPAQEASTHDDSHDGAAGDQAQSTSLPVAPAAGDEQATADGTQADAGRPADGLPTAESEAAMAALFAEAAQGTHPPAAGSDEGSPDELQDEGERIAEAILQKALPPHLEGGSGEDSSAFPVLPQGRPPAADAQPSAAPPPWVTPRPTTTPGPAALVDRPSARRRVRRSIVVFGTLGVLAAAAVLAAALPFVFSPRQPAPVEVRTIAAAPSTVYRYFEGAAPIAAVPGPVLRFPSAGKVVRIAGQGTAVAVGDVVAAVDKAKGLQNQLAHQRERLAYNQQMAEAMHEVGNTKEEERQLAKVAAKKAAIAKLLGELAGVAVIANAPGEVEESLAREGQVVEADSPALRLRSPGFRASFEFSGGQATSARRLGFCQVEVEGYLLDCSPAQVSGDETHVAVDLPSVPLALVGKPAHLARARYSSAVLLPMSALRISGSRVEVLLVSGNARLETRQVVVAERDDVEAIVVQGLDVADRVAVEPGLGLRPGMVVGGAKSR